MGGMDTPFSASAKSSHPEVMYSLTSLSELFELGLLLASELELEEVRASILRHMRRAIRARGACLLLYYQAQERFVPVASQGEKFACGTLASMLDGRDTRQFSIQGPGATLDTLLLEGTRVLLVSLSWRDVFLGLVALTLAETDSLAEERGLLLHYMGSVAAQILYMNDVRSDELRSALFQERNRIARELHDGVVQQMAYALYKLELVQQLLVEGAVDQVGDEIKRVVAVLHEGLQDLRSATTSLLPARLDARTFNEALAALVQDFQLDNPALTVEQNVAQLPPIPARLEATIFRVIQEALNNVRKHALATRVTLRIEQLADVVQLEVRDNGCGFDTRMLHSLLRLHSMTEDGTATRGQGDAGSHSGLRGMYERVQEVGGFWHITSRPGVGTAIQATFPALHTNSQLTDREREVLQLVVAGLDNHAIARRLSIRSETVKKHVQHITHKLNMKDRSQVVAMVARPTSRSDRLSSSPPPA